MTGAEQAFGPPHQPVRPSPQAGSSRYSRPSAITAPAIMAGPKAMWERSPARWATQHAERNDSPGDEAGEEAEQRGPEAEPAEGQTDQPRQLDVAEPQRRRGDHRHDEVQRVERGHGDERRRAAGASPRRRARRTPGAPRAPGRRAARGRRGGGARRRRPTRARPRARRRRGMPAVPPSRPGRPGATRGSPRGAPGRAPATRPRGAPRSRARRTRCGSRRWPASSR